MTLLKNLFSILILVVTTLWGVFAIYFGDSQANKLQTGLAILFGLLGLAALIGHAFAVWRRGLLIAYFGVFSVILVFWLSITPSNERQWQKDAAILAYATFDGDHITVYNIRNFDYHSEFDYQPAYYSKTFDLDKLEGVDLFSVYWMGPAIAHTILSFHFSDNKYLAISIEARKQQNEGYSTIKGFFRQYELIYYVADERDVIRLRTNYRKDPPEQVFLYRAQGSKENAKRLFIEYMRKVNELNQQPEFYNTLLDNCTTAIWLRSLVNHDHLPFDWKILLSGYLPEYLYEQHKLDHSVSFPELTRRAYINDLANSADKLSDFSTRIRQFQD